MAHLIEVAFPGNRKAFYQWDGAEPPALKAPVIVEADRGEDLGHVHATGERAELRCTRCTHGCGPTPPTARALRLATPEDEARWRQLRTDAEQARREAMRRAKAHQLVMKVTDAEWQWDGRKLTFYFTSEARVDFRALVRDLAAHFRTRIELKQIGVRDEARRLSGVGRCGREYCSASWLPELRPVNLSVAKDQRLSLNPTQISGACGRLMCCLRHEHEFYVQQRKRFPKEGKVLALAGSEARVVANDIFRERVTLRLPDGELRVIPLAELRRELDAPASPPTPESAAGEEERAPLKATADGATLVRAPRSAAVAPAMPPAADAPEAADDEDDAEAPDGAADAPSALEAGTTPEGGPRPRRRRGRRGGRRGRGGRPHGSPADGGDPGEGPSSSADRPPADPS